MDIIYLLVLPKRVKSDRYRHTNGESSTLLLSCSDAFAVFSHSVGKWATIIFPLVLTAAGEISPLFNLDTKCTKNTGFYKKRTAKQYFYHIKGQHTLPNRCKSSHRVMTFNRLSGRWNIITQLTVYLCQSDWNIKAPIGTFEQTDNLMHRRAREKRAHATFLFVTMISGNGKLCKRLAIAAEIFNRFNFPYCSSRSSLHDRVLDTSHEHAIF